jgi:hypothetical protein
MLEFERDLKRTSKKSLIEAEKSRVYDAMFDKTAVFILDQIIQDEDIEVEDVDVEISGLHDSSTNDIQAPQGWLSFARLWRADLVTIAGNTVFPTERGEQVHKIILATMTKLNASKESTTP